LSRKCGGLNISQPYGPSCPAAGMALPFSLPLLILNNGILVSFDFGLSSAYPKGNYWIINLISYNFIWKFLEKRPNINIEYLCRLKTSIPNK
jgi:hypothetical protein